ncbi:MAG: DUF2835 domain-containing protein [Thiogranum sp.]|nr:DUF2835 domain-containing protein [Thiogranum sp.]
MGATEYLVPLEISAEAYLRLYQGTARTVLAQDTRGLKVSFPAQALRPFVTRVGIHGLFVISVDDSNKLLDIKRKTF